MNKERAAGPVFLELTPVARIHPEIVDEMTPQKENELVRRFKDGCDVSFGMLYEHHREKVFRRVKRMVGNTEDAEDLVNISFEKAYKAKDKYQITGAPFVSWVLKIAHNQSVNHLRSKKDKTQLNDGILDVNPRADVHSIAELNEDIEKVRLAMLELKAKQGEAVSMRFLEGLKFSEIAELQGRTVNAVRVDIHRGMKKLREAVGEINTLDISSEGVA